MLIPFEGGRGMFSVVETLEKTKIKANYLIIKSQQVYYSYSFNYFDNGRKFTNYQEIAQKLICQVFFTFPIIVRKEG